MHLKFLDPEITRKLLEGHKDTLSQAVEQQEQFYASQYCPQCGGSCRKIGDSRTLFSQDDILPRFYLQCLACGCEFDPKTGIISVLGNVAKAVEPNIPIIGKETKQFHE